jgi:eukaryotic-like serine/threonine-protein kinase
MIGQTVLHYTIIEKLGEGGMGVVYRAHDTNLDRDVALKFLPEHLLDDSAEEARLLQEAKAAAILNHPNICDIHALGEFQGRRFIDMEYVDGETLAKRIKSETGGRPLDSFAENAQSLGVPPYRAGGSGVRIEDAVRFAIEIGEALQEAHSKGIIHRDVKADNVMINSRNRVKVMDFGLAKLKGSVKLANSSTTSGTMAYMAPEQIQGEDADARADLFSLGVLLYQMLTGQMPFRGDHEAAVMYSVLNEEPPPASSLRPDIPEGLGSIVERALKKNPAERYQSAAEIIADLRHFEESVAPIAGATARQTSLGTFGWARKRWMRPVLLIMLALAIVVAATYFFSNRSSGTYGSIAVLPLSNETRDPGQDYLADGLTENLINSLSTFPEIKLMSRSSVFRFKGKDISPEEAGKELGVNAVLTGRLKQTGRSLNVSLELVDVQDHSHIWGEQYECRADEIQDVQKDIVQKVAKRLKLSFTDDQQAQLSKGSTENAEAYQLYLKGRFFLNKRTAEGFQRAMEFFRQATEQAPMYAPAYAGLATTYLLQAIYDIRKPKAASELARAAAREALRFDERSAEAHTVLASLPGYDWPTFEKEYLRALELNPNYVIAQHWYGEFLVQTGRVDEGMIHLQKALELDPLAPIHYAALARTLMVQHRDDEALAQLGTSLDIDPQFPWGYAMLAHVHLRLGHRDFVLPSIDKAILYSDSSTDYIARRGLLLGLLGKKTEAEKTLRQVLSRSKKEYVPFSVQALPYVGLGRIDEAFRLLNHAVEDTETALNDINVDPLFDSLRDDPRFATLKQRIGLQ